MKIAAIVLLVANVAVFSWQYSQHVDEKTRAALTRPALPSDVPALVLLREMDGLPEPRTSSNEIEPAPPAPELIENVVGANICLETGPFETETQRDNYRDWLRDFAAVIDGRVETVRKRQLFWVYLEPTTDEHAKESIADLEQRGVQDYMLIRRGGLRNAISLGLFSSQDSVNRRLAELNEQGYTPIVVPRYETSDRYWVSAQLSAENTVLPDPPTDLNPSPSMNELNCDELELVTSQTVPDPITEEQSTTEDRSAELSAYEETSESEESDRMASPSVDE